MEADQDRCMRIIEPVLGVLYDCLHDGMAFYNDPANYSAEALAQQRGRTATNCVYDHAFHRARELLSERQGCHFLNMRGLEVLNVKDEAVIRLKKVNGIGQGRNYQTPQQRHYNDQLSFPELPDAAVRLVAGYQPDAMFTAIDRVIISRPIGRNIEWAAQVNRFDERMMWEIITSPALDGFNRRDFDPARRRGGRRT